MTLFQRSDADLIPELSPMRRIMPYLMPSRPASVVYHAQQLDLSRTLPFIETWNQRTGAGMTLFDLILAACGRTLHARPGMNRFVSGGRIYQRRRVHIAYGAKRELSDEAALLMVKLEICPGEPLLETVQHAHAAVRECRAAPERPLEREIRWFTALPGPMLRAAVKTATWLDAWNILPDALSKNDPMFSSMFLANLGSVGLGRAYHHLYEYGTASAFGVLGAVDNDSVDLRWTFDERINDGFYSAASLALLRKLIEQPELLEPTAGAGSAGR
jgi:hypothetical protein